MVIRIAPIACLAACFGGGPTPTDPADAKTILFAPPAQEGQFCSGGARYIDEVGFTGDKGYATVLPYAPMNGCDNGGSINLPQIPVDVLAFPKDGSFPQGTSM